MRQFLYFLLLSFIFINPNIGQKHSGPINWLSLSEADSLYKIQPKPMFIDVYTDWCGWCKRMDATTFQDQSVASYLNANFYPVKLDAEMDDSVVFMGNTYHNTQKDRVQSILDSLTNELTKLTEEIKSSDSLIDSKIKALKYPQSNYQAFTQECSKYTNNEEEGFTENFKASLYAFKKELSKVDQKRFKKDLKKLSKLKNKDQLSATLKPISDYEKILSDSLANLQNLKRSNPLSAQLAQQKAQFSNFKRRARKTTHDVAIDLCRGNMSYPTFILLFADSLKANLPLKGFQKPLELYGYLAFVAEGVFKTSRDVAGFVDQFKTVYSPSYEVPKDGIKWKGFEAAIKAAKKDKKKIMVHIVHPNSVTSNIMDKETFRDKSTIAKVNKSFHSVKLFINNPETINYKEQEFKNVNGVHQLALALAKNKLTFPHVAFLDSDGNLVMNVPQYFAKTEINPVLDYFIEEGYLKANYGDWLKSKKK